MSSSILELQQNYQKRESDPQSRAKLLQCIDQNQFTQFSKLLSLGLSPNFVHQSRVPLIAVLKSPLAWSIKNFFIDCLHRHQVDVTLVDGTGQNALTTLLNEIPHEIYSATFNIAQSLLRQFLALQKPYDFDPHYRPLASLKLRSSAHWVDPAGVGLLHYAFKTGLSGKALSSVCEVLLEHELDLSNLNEEGQIPLLALLLKDRSLLSANADLQMTLLNKGSPIDLADHQGRTVRSVLKSINEVHENDRSLPPLDSLHIKMHKLIDFSYLTHGQVNPQSQGPAPDTFKPSDPHSAHLYEQLQDIKRDNERLYEQMMKMSQEQLIPNEKIMALDQERAALRKELRDQKRDAMDQMALQLKQQREHYEALMLDQDTLIASLQEKLSALAPSSEFTADLDQEQKSSGPQTKDPHDPLFKHLFFKPPI